MDRGNRLRQRVLSGRSDANIRLTTFDGSYYAWGSMNGCEEVITSSEEMMSMNGSPCNATGVMPNLTKCGR